MGDRGIEPVPESGSVKKTTIRDVWESKLGKKMWFLFDYGDDWIFEIELLKIREDNYYKPHLLNSRFKFFKLLDASGDSPEQYPELEDEGKELTEKELHRIFKDSTPQTKR